MYTCTTLTNVHSTGSTGYIGGSVLHTLATAHPNWPITVLLRRVPPTFSTTYPRITVLHGDYDATSILSTAAENADIVIHCGDSDHEPSLRALLTGLRRKKEGTGYLIHLSGTGLVSDWASESFLGRKNPKVWSDAHPSDMAELRALPDSALHRATEKILHSAVREESGHNVRIAIVCPPDIYGKGKGLVKTQSALIPFLVNESKKLGRVFFANEGANTRSWVHIDDLMRLYLRIVEAAAADGDAVSKDQWFGENGYFFAATQEHEHIEIARRVGEVMARKGIVQDPNPVRVSLEQLDGMANLPNFPRLARYLFASSSRTRADRAGELWGYSEEAPGLIECLEEDVEEALMGSG
ncbi:nucleoside-diphosphate-sugar epimerase [Stagonosporopsis vannaccii]|nr:nucleoside-diphosphate-sugar epimerase [Stagonosporopsis vannaccii]